uniref:Selenoprotein P N-terminal domain-containing protein n=1 Tax=Anopheles christyi TaxID=43041 RepID=A0A182JSN7_9DIPT
MFAARAILGLLVLCCCGLAASQEMSISEELETCSTLDRPVLVREFGGDGADDFFGKITVLYNVAPPKPVQTPRIFADRDPIFYNKIDYREQIKYYYNLYQTFHSQPEYRNDVRFLLSASLHRVPYELEEYNFATFFNTVQTLAGEYNLTVYPNHLNENRTFALFGLREFQVYVIDRCSRVSYIIQPPWSLIQYAYVKAAVLSTFYDRPCGKCELENFLNSTLTGSEKLAEIKADATKDARPYDDASDEFSNPTDEEVDNDGIRSYSEEDDDDENDADGDGRTTDWYKNETDPFANLSLTEPEVNVSLRIILPVLHIHVPAENDTTKDYKLHEYIVLHTVNHTEDHWTHPTKQETNVEELSLPLGIISTTNTTVTTETGKENTTSIRRDKIRIGGTDWSAEELSTILNASSVLYDRKEQRVFERLQRYNLTDRGQYDEVAEISVSNRYDAWNRRRSPPKSDPTRSNRRSQIKKHYARLIPWLNWTFGRAIPPTAGRQPISGSSN